MNNMTIKEYAEFITVDINTPMFITFSRQPNMPNILSCTIEMVKRDDITWYSSFDECVNEILTLIQNNATTFSDAIIEAQQNQPNIETLSDTDIASHYITRQSRRGSGNLVVNDQFIVYTNIYDKSIDGPLVIVVDGNNYGIATNHGLNGISGYMVDMMV